MGKRIVARRNETNAAIFVEGTDYVSMDEKFDAIALVAGGELVVGKIHRFFITEIAFNYLGGAKLVFKDLPHYLGQFKAKDDDESGLEWIDHRGTSPAVLTTTGGEEVTVTASLVLCGYTNPETGTTELHADAPDLLAIFEDGSLNPDSVFLPSYKAQACPSKYLSEKSGFILEATAEVATA